MALVLGVLLAVLGLLGLLGIVPLGFGEGHTLAVLISLLFLFAGIALVAYSQGLIKTRRRL